MDTYAERMEAALSNRTRIEIAERYMTQKDLSEAVGVGRPAMNHSIKGHKSMPMPTFFKVAEALDVAPHVLLQRAEERITDPPAEQS